MGKCRKDWLGMGLILTRSEKTSPNSPWQNGRCERHGGIWKDIYYTAHEECLPKNKNDVNELVDKVT